MKNIKPFLISVAALGTFIPLANLPSNRVSGAGVPTIIDDDTFESSYDINSYLTVPFNDELYFVNDSSLKKVSYGEIVFPDGSVKIPGKHELNLPGVYTISYFDKDNNSFKKQFVVNKNNYESQKGVSASFTDSISLHEGHSGISIDLATGSNFKFNKIVDLKSFPEGIVDVCKIYPNFKEKISDVPKSSFITLKLVDAYDSSKFVEFYIWTDIGIIPFYVGAGASFQNLTGMEFNPNRPDKVNCYYESIPYNCHNVSRYQSIEAYGVFTNYYANQDDVDGIYTRKGFRGSEGIMFEWDLNSNKIKEKSCNKFVTDLDAPEIYDTNVLNFDEFFTTGEVYAQIEAFCYNSSSVNVQIEEILGLKGDELKDAIIIDDKAPEIITNFVNDETNELIVCKDQEFMIPKDVITRDINFYGDLSCNVYYNYGQEDQISIYSKDSFTPTLLGKYSLVYTAKDGYGNVTKKVIGLNCVNEKAFKYEERKLTDLTAAALNVLPRLNVVGINGEVNEKCYVVDPNENRYELELNNEQTGYDLVPYYFGDYKIVYELSDSFYHETFEYTLNAKDTGSVYFEKAPIINPAYIKNASYSIDEFVGYKASVNGKVKVEMTPYISKDGGDFNVVTSPLNYQIDASETIQIKYKNGQVEYLTDVIPVVDLNYGQKITSKQYEKYFIGNTSSATVEDESLKYGLLADEQIKLINHISSSNFALNFTLSNNTGDDFEIKLLDLNAKDDYLKIKFLKQTSTIYQIAFEQKVGDQIFTKSMIKPFVSSTIDAKLSIFGNRVIIENVTEFNISPLSDLVELSMVSNNAADVDIKLVNNQTFASSGMREFAPTGTYKVDSGALSLGDKINISPLSVSSVLSPITMDNVTVTVLDTKGNAVTSDDGILLDSASATREYKITLNEIGQYNVTYSITYESSDRRGSTTLTNEDTYYIVNVIDTIPPVVHFSSNVDCEIEKCTTIKIRDLSYSDNYTASERLRVFILVIDENHNIIESGFNCEECTFFKEGNYKVIAYVYDSIGNCATDSYNVIVR